MLTFQPEYDEAAALLKEVRAADPCNLSNVDILSNILYVREDKPALAALARSVQVRQSPPLLCL